MGRKLKGNSSFFLFNQHGFSLAEIMVAAGMLGVLSLGVSQLMQNSAKTEKRLSQQVNLITLDAQIFEALQDTTACERTLGMIGGAGPNANTGGTFNALPTNAIYRGNNPESGTDTTKWNVAVQAYDGADAGIYGSGSNTVYVKSIEYAGFLKDNVDTKYADSGNYSAGARTAIPGTADFWGTIVLHVDFRRGNPASYESLGSEAERELKAKRSLYGQYKVPRYYKLNVRVNPANQIVSCYAYDEIMSDTYCSLLDGHLDMATGRCTNIKIRTSPFKAAEATPDLWSMTAYTVDGQDGNALIQGGFQVGGAITDAPPAVGNAYIQGDTQDDGNIFIGDTTAITTPIPAPLATGNLSAQNDILIGRDGQVNRQFRSETEALFKGRVNMGPDTIDNSENYLLKVTSTTTSDKVIFESSGGNSSRIEMNNALGTNGKILLNDTGSEPLKILDGANLVFRVNQNGRVDFYNGNGGGLHTTIVRNSGRIDIMDGTNNDGMGRAVTIIGDGSPGDNYRPIIIKNQGTSVADMRVDSTSTGQEVPTKDWVKTMVYGSGVYDDDDIQTILSNISKYAQHHTKDAITSYVCGKMRLYRKSAADTSCSMVGTQCRCAPVNCSTEGLASNASVCKDIFLSGRLTAENVVANQNVRALGNVIANGSMLADGFITADGYIESKTFVKGARVFAGNIGGGVPNGWVGAADGVRANTRVCVNSTSGNCYTRFGKFMCPWQRVMVGIAYGQPVCAKVGP